MVPLSRYYPENKDTQFVGMGSFINAMAFIGLKIPESCARKLSA